MNKTTLAFCAFGLLAARAAHAQQPPIKIGFISTFSGPSGQLGQKLLDSFRLGLKSTDGKMGGRAIEIIQGDDPTKQMWRSAARDDESQLGGAG